MHSTLRRAAIQRYPPSFAWHPHSSACNTISLRHYSHSLLLLSCTLPRSLFFFLFSFSTTLSHSFAFFSISPLTPPTSRIRCSSSLFPTRSSFHSSYFVARLFALSYPFFTEFIAPSPVTSQQHASFSLFVVGPGTSCTRFFLKVPRSGLSLCSVLWSGCPGNPVAFAKD